MSTETTQTITTPKPKKELGLFKTTGKAIKDVVRESGVALSATAITASSTVQGLQQEVQSVVSKRAFDLSVSELKHMPIKKRIELELKKLENAELSLDEIDVIFETVDELQAKIAIFG